MFLISYYSNIEQNISIFSVIIVVKILNNFFIIILKMLFNYKIHS